MLHTTKSQQVGRLPMVFILLLNIIYTDVSVERLSGKQKVGKTLDVMKLDQQFVVCSLAVSQVSGNSVVCKSALSKLHNR